MIVYRAYIHLGNNEWGNELMQKVAEAYAAEHADKRPLIVSLHEGLSPKGVTPQSL